MQGRWKCLRENPHFVWLPFARGRSESVYKNLPSRQRSDLECTQSHQRYALISLETLNEREPVVWGSYRAIFQKKKKQEQVHKIMHKNEIIMIAKKTVQFMLKSLKTIQLSVVYIYTATTIIIVQSYNIGTVCYSKECKTTIPGAKTLQLGDSSIELSK